MTVDHLTLPNSTLPEVRSTRFADFELAPMIVRALERNGLTSPTPIQLAVIPDAMAGRDVLGRARTGSGKTLAFGLPVLMRLAGERSRPHKPRGLIIVPTRELAMQVRRSLEPLADTVGLRMVTVYGGTPYSQQIKRISRGADVVVATPGRLDDLVRRDVCRLGDVEVTVLDEADHLCDLGFFPVVSDLLSKTPDGAQRLLLSATLDGDVDALVRKHLSAPIVHEVDSDQGAVTTMDHHLLVVAPHDKVSVAIELVRANPRSIVFTRTREGATTLAKQFVEAGVPAVDLHGELSQRVRERNLQRFRSGRAEVVVATDVAARGIHVAGVSMVVHFDPPSEAKSYLHRSGRTARAGESGAVVTVVTPRQISAMSQLHRRAGVEVRHHDARTAPRPLTAESLAEAPISVEPVMRTPRKDRTRREHTSHSTRRGRPGFGDRGRSTHSSPYRKARTNRVGG